MYDYNLHQDVGNTIGPASEQRSMLFLGSYAPYSGRNERPGSSLLFRESFVRHRWSDALPFFPKVRVSSRMRCFKLHTVMKIRIWTKNYVLCASRRKEDLDLAFAKLQEASEEPRKRDRSSIGIPLGLTRVATLDGFVKQMRSGEIDLTQAILVGSGDAVMLCKQLLVDGSAIGSLP